MKKITLLLFFIFVFIQIFAQVYKGQDAERFIQGADIVRVKDISGIPDFIHFRQAISMNIEKSLIFTKSLMNNEAIDLKLKNVQKNRGTEQTYRYTQTYYGIPVEFTAWYLQFDGERVYAMNGTILNKININPTFNITEEAALQLAIEYSGAEKYMWEFPGEESLLKEFTNDVDASYYPKATKLIVPANAKFNNETIYHTAYRFDIYSKIPYKRNNVYVDANTGEILFDMSIIQVSDEIGNAETVYSGPREINTEYNGSEFILSDNTRGNGVRTLNCNMGIDYEAATEFTDDDNNWNNVNAELDQYATDAQFATMSTYDYFLNIHGRNSIDGDGLQLWSFIHFDLVENGGSSNVNAFWNGQWMTYGDGDAENETTPLTTVDICGHEITHGLTSYTCGLNYQDESGALNEAFSDIFGASVEFYAVPLYADWTVGEDIGFAFRSLSDPNETNKPDTYQGNFWVFGSEDYGGVHTNMSPLCYWYYLLSEGGSGVNDNGDSYSVTAIGLDKAEKIAFRLQTVYLTPTSQYSDAWFYALQAASDLYGACSDEVQAVGDGFYAIGVADAPYVNEVHAGFDAGYTESCQPPFEVQFINESYNGDNFLWNFGDGTTSDEIHPTHIYTDYGYFDVQLDVDGSACGSASETIENYIAIDESIPCLTLMPTSGNDLIENCNGIIYDAGGPDNNYFDNTNASITIYAPGSSSIVLNILELNIEPGSESDCNFDYIAFYNGNSTSAELINLTHYCNTTGNPETISSTGEYITIEFYSDGGLTLSGFKIQYDCVGNENPPTPYFSASPESTCDGLIEFNDNSLNFPTSWEWDFGDGNTNNEQDPTHYYNANGTYNVSLTVENEFGQNELLKENYITINMPDAPQIDPIQACSNTAFEINLELEGEAYWYENTTSETPEHIGNYWEHTAILETEIYYLREVFPGEEFNLGETNNTDGGSYFGNPSYIHYLVFDAYSPFILESVEVNADGAGERVIALRTSTQQTIEQITVNCPNGVSRIDLNFNVPAGEDLQLVGIGTPNLFRTNESSYLNYPYTIEDIASIKESSASADPTYYYYYFYDWKISTPSCKSPFVEIELIPEECTANIDSKLLNNITIAPNPSQDNFFIYGLDQEKSYSIVLTDISGKLVNYTLDKEDTYLNIKGLSPGIYFTRIITDNEQKVIKLIKQ
jgi:Zn-dependent metalloprotease